MEEEIVVGGDELLLDGSSNFVEVPVVDVLLVVNESFEVESSESNLGMDDWELIIEKTSDQVWHVLTLEVELSLSSPEKDRWRDPLQQRSVVKSVDDLTVLFDLTLEILDVLSLEGSDLKVEGQSLHVLESSLGESKDGLDRWQSITQQSSSGVGLEGVIKGQLRSHELLVLKVRRSEHDEVCLRISGEARSLDEDICVTSPGHVIDGTDCVISEQVTLSLLELLFSVADTVKETGGGCTALYEWSSLG